MGTFLLAFCPIVMGSEDLNQVSESSKTTSTTTSPPALCDCAINVTDHFLEHALLMKNQMENKTTFLSKIRHRTTHSKDAVWASLSISCIVVMLVVGVMQSKMWNHRPHVSSMESQPVKYEQYNTKAEIMVKELLRSRGRTLLDLFPRRRKAKIHQSSLRMDSFLSGHRDTVDSSHQALLASSSGEEWIEDDEESDEEVVFRINRRTGEWEGEERSSLLNKRRRRTSSSSSCSSRGVLDSSISRDLLRLSSEDSDTDEMMVKVG